MILKSVCTTIDRIKIIKLQPILTSFYRSKTLETQITYTTQNLTNIILLILITIHGYCIQLQEKPFRKFILLYTFIIKKH